MNNTSHTKKENKISLWLIICIALSATGVILFSVGLTFVHLEYGTIFVTLDQNELFAVVRNTVTAVAALGLGATIVISYRKQVTAEQSQKTAYETLKATVQGLQINLDSSERAKEMDLRTRYSTSVSLLSDENQIKRFAGVSSLVELADDWANHGNDLAKESIVRLLALQVPSETSPGTDKVIDAIEEVLIQRISKLIDPRRQWSGYLVNLYSDDSGIERTEYIDEDLNPNTVIKDLLITSRTQVRLQPRSNSKAKYGDIVVRAVTLNEGILDLSNSLSEDSKIDIADTEFLLGKANFLISGKPTFKFKNCIFGRAEMSFPCLDTVPEAIFENCTFDSNFSYDLWHFHPEITTFNDCSFTSFSAITEYWMNEEHVRLNRTRVEGVVYETMDALKREWEERLNK